MAYQTTVQLEGINVSDDCKSLRNVEAYKFYLMNFVKTRRAPLDTPLWPRNKWTVLKPGTRLCLWDKGNGVPCLHTTTNRNNLGAHYKEHAKEYSLQPPEKGSGSRSTAIAYYEDMARKHQAARKAGKSVKKLHFVLDDDPPLDDCEEDAEIAREWGPPAGYFVQALMPMPMEADGSGLSKPAVQNLMKALDPNSTCGNNACIKARLCLQNASCVLWSKFEHVENEPLLQCHCKRVR
ncbi:hypothetical protein E4U57_006847 [Claviceps arundinis]|uniref:Uncharacterized protein n=1 Tax=Claviceps arundinis TaxID=1623583 RepID=A0ABQ7PG75_9HYPO|nr:hypothetical protein E4U57_006847 [Claviceps arundinis]